MTGRRLFSLFSALALSIASRASAQTGAGTLSGRVTSTDGQPLQGASVSIANSQRGAITRADGSYQVTLPAGRHELRVRQLGYSAVRDFVDITSGGTTTKNFALERAATSLEAVAIIGTRGEERSVISAPAPIDVLSSVDIQQTGRTETAQMIQAVAPSINFPRTSIGDGTDHIRPATLRGLAPDQALVLINGKRRHTSALVNLNGFVGRGSQAVDLNAIPASMIDHIEILRDGAAAQYGSDAIAGVINIVLKSTATGSFSTTVGENVTTYNRDATSTVAYPAQMNSISARDGKIMSSALNYGFTFGQNGYVQVGGEVRDRQGTNRTLPDTRQQYFAGDSRNNAAPQINHWQGDSYNHDTDGFVNAGTTLSNGIEVYGFGGWGRRHGASAGFWRRALDDRTLRNLYPDGFLPFIKSTIRDASVAGGLTGTYNNWKWNLGTVFGQNSFRFRIDNSANVSLGPSSPTTFNAGRLADAQTTTTLDLSRAVLLRGKRPLRIGVGGEIRGDFYAISAGDSDSFRNGGVQVLDANGQPTGRVSPVGSQVFPGFQPSDAKSHSRSNQAYYVDLESDLTTSLLVGIAGRVEHYSDFGSTSTGKIAARYQPIRGLVLRGTTSTGFRAPSLGQEFFSSTATNFISGTAFEIRTFPVETAPARVLGARPLLPEKSLNFSVGMAVEPLKQLAFTADYYDIAIKDRIVLSDNFVQPIVRQILADSGITGVSGGRYFTNAIDTRSHGVDLVANYGYRFTLHDVIRFTSGYNSNQVKVIHVDSTPRNLSSLQETLFGRVERTRIERGNPRNNLFISGNYAHRWLSLTARTQRYGKVSVAGTTPTNATGTLDQTYAAKWITDLSAAATVRNKYVFVIGADNVFDVYPDRNLNPGDITTSNGGISNFGIFPYAAISPFGFNGRFIYTKLTFGL